MIRIQGDIHSAKFMEITYDVNVISMDEDARSRFVSMAEVADVEVQMSNYGGRTAIVRHSKLISKELIIGGKPVQGDFYMLKGLFICWKEGAKE